MDQKASSRSHDLRGDSDRRHHFNKLQSDILGDGGDVVEERMELASRAHREASLELVGMGDPGVFSVGTYVKASARADAAHSLCTDEPSETASSRALLDSTRLKTSLQQAISNWSSFDVEGDVDSDGSHLRYAQASRAPSRQSILRAIHARIQREEVVRVESPG